MQLDTILNGDCLDRLTEIDDNSVDLLCTDPPYGYSFMGKDWDKAVPTVDVWKECLRVLKPGAFAFIMSAPRQDVLSRMIVRIGEAGFETGFTSIYWTYASGFPKAANIGKLVDKRLGAERPVVGQRWEPNRKPNMKEAGSLGEYEPDTGLLTAPATPEAKTLDGSYGGFQPKPAVEVIIVAMKPLSEKTFVDQALKNAKGITWLDDARIPGTEALEYTVRRFKPGADLERDGEGWKQDAEYTGTTKAGRFPANLLVSDDVLNDGKLRASGALHGTYRTAPNDIYGSYGDDEKDYTTNSGSYSRYFDLDAWWEERAKQLPPEVREVFPFLIVPKASKSEKNGSKHPTVKPIKLMSYLITLGSRLGDLVLDPFCGSGTTCIAARILDRHYIGIDQDIESCLDSNRRLAAYNTLRHAS